MAFKRFLILLRSYPAMTDGAAIASAVDIAAAWQARISALSCAIFPRVPQSPLVGVFIDLPAMLGQAHARIASEAQELLQGFADTARKRSVLGQELFRKCAPDDVPALLAGHARLHDLTVMPMPDGDYLGQLDSHWYVETAPFEAGRPVLVLPHGHRAAEMGAFATIAVAWDNSRAAARAIADAMPVLQRAKSVRVVTIVSEKAIGSDPQPGEILDFLAAHGVGAVHDMVEAEGRAAGAALTTHLRQHSADLLVMGGYGHSRMREIVLGGVTKSMLTHRQCRSSCRTRGTVARCSLSRSFSSNIRQHRWLRPSPSHSANRSSL
jgi:nucleotide-binding universal stress UspA family protein